jgi:hypothetical protein
MRGRGSSLGGMVRQALREGGGETRPHEMVAELACLEHAITLPVGVLPRYISNGADYYQKFVTVMLC